MIPNKSQHQQGAAPLVSIHVPKGTPSVTYPRIFRVSCLDESKKKAKKEGTSSKIGLCYYCRKEEMNLQTCSLRKDVRYCSKEYQKDHWPVHKIVCTELGKVV